MNGAHMTGGDQRYAGRLRILHWVIAVLVLATWPLGLMIGFVKDDVKLDFYLVHESLGFLVLWLMLVRIGARLTSQAPRVEAPVAEKAAAHAVHGLLYVFLIVMPVSGFLATNAHGFPLNWFGLVTVWSPIGKAPDIAFTLSAIHAWSAWILLALFALHFAAVVFHHVIRRDATLYRIL
ncbi:cytochrome b561 [Peteryoungia aggregata LMG 23059]|uniref:Cytochrome b561 n=1 Tax=Peteryoungia aggregata LMG 23059 TaxID=1368425 RepID=A0ABU0G631_9HYPH|nr:cytochrome b [Peteryoungia aggregata]MDQ0420777.1 cytochrome b561 [Peteryoungia aggregata LMG 23059]